MQKYIVMVKSVNDNRDTYIYYIGKNGIYTDIRFVKGWERDRWIKMAIEKDKEKYGKNGNGWNAEYHILEI